MNEVLVVVIAIAVLIIISMIVLHKVDTKLASKGMIDMSETPVSRITVKAAEEYLNSIAAPMTRMEYLFYLKEANDEGRERRSLHAAIETKDQWMKIDHWSRFTKDLREEFYIAYRSGYAHFKEEAEVSK